MSNKSKKQFSLSIKQKNPSNSFENCWDKSHLPMSGTEPIKKIVTSITEMTIFLCLYGLLFALIKDQRDGTLFRHDFSETAEFFA
jgi:hypothetical protein